MGGGNYDALLHAAEKSSAMKAQTREERLALERTAREEREEAEAATREAEVRGCDATLRRGFADPRAAQRPIASQASDASDVSGRFCVGWVRCGRRSG